MAQSEYAVRRGRLLAHLAEEKIGAALVTWLPNVRYLTGFTGSNAVALLTPEKAVLYTDPRYTIQASQESDCKVRVGRGQLLKLISAAVAKHKIRKLGFEKGHISWFAHDYLKERLRLGGSLEPLNGVIERLRAVKSESEIALIRQSVNTNSQAFDKAMKSVRPGVSESELAAEIDYQTRRLGAEKQAFDTIVAAGERSALPHASPTANPVKANQLLLVDMGAMQDGYASDMTRTMHVGKPSAKVRGLYRAVLEAQLAAVAVVREGIAAREPDRAARLALEKHGLEKKFVHSTGHGLGLEIHEPPRLGKREKTKLTAGMVITIEPGVYLEGTGGIRIEDTVLVTRTGCEILTPTSKEFTVL